jgi:hypothetical protein
MTHAERNYMFVTVGAGDTFAAIATLVNLIAARQIPLRWYLAQQCATWLNAYQAHNAYEHLRGMIESFVVLTTTRVSASNRSASATPKSPPPLAIKVPYRSTRRRATGAADCLVLRK